MYGRIDPVRRTTQNISDKINSANGTLTRGAHFFLRRKLNETNNVNKFDNKYHKQINRNKINNSTYLSETSNSTDSTNISSHDNSDNVLQNNINPLFKEQMENIQRMKNSNKQKSDTNNNNELNMSFDQLKSDKQFMKNIEQISEVFTKINGSTHSSIELIYNFKHMTNNILSYFSTISNQKEHIEDVLLKLVEHLSDIIIKKGSNESNSKLSGMIANNNQPIKTDSHSETNTDSHSETNTDSHNEINSESTSNNSITIKELLKINSVSDNSNLIKNTQKHESSIDDNIFISTDSNNTMDNLPYSKPRIFGY